MKYYLASSAIAERLKVTRFRHRVTAEDGQAYYVLNGSDLAPLDQETVRKIMTDGGLMEIHQEPSQIVDLIKQEDRK